MSVSNFQYKGYFVTVNSLFLIDDNQYKAQYVIKKINGLLEQGYELNNHKYDSNEQALKAGSSSAKERIDKMQ